MSNNAPTNFNISLTPGDATKGTQPNAQTKATTKTGTRNVNIAPLTEYNRETGLRETRADSPWGAPSSSPDAQQPSEVATDQDKPAASPDRHAAWKKAQAEQKATREQAKLDRQVKEQALAREHLKKGDLTSAAKALGMTPAEFQAYTQNALLAIPTPDKEQTPEQKRQAEDEKFRADRLAFEKEQREWRYMQTANDFIRANIEPVLKDTDKYEFINEQEKPKIYSYIYEFMNKHYQETQETLSVNDIADEIENQLFNTYKASVEKGKKLKKAASLFAPVVEDQQEDGEQHNPNASIKKGKRLFEIDTPSDPFAEPTLANKRGAALDSRFPSRGEDYEAEAEELEKQELPRAHPVKTASGKSVPFALMSAAERHEQMRRERQNKA